MWRGLGVWIGALFVAANAHGADKPAIGPAPAWALTADDPAPGPAADNTSAVRILLQDVQEHFGADGDSEYHRTVVKIQTPQGLSIAGSVGLLWNPETDTLTVHKLTITRGAQVINVLAKQDFLVLRRENKLEYAMLDGVLTATIQPEGLQVGDTLDIAYTLKRNDPVMKGASERIAALNQRTPADHVRLRALWAPTKAMRWRVTDDIKDVQTKITNGENELLIDLRNPPPLHPPKGAPARYQEARELEVTEFKSWADVSALFAPLYDKASTLASDSPLHAEAAKIRAASNDPKVQAGLALALVQDQTRYVFLGMNLGGLTPAPADVTWQRRFGDCKGKTALLLALLHELGIAAQPAVVSSTGGDGLDAHLPTVSAFDHIIVRATIAGKVYWLDGTRSGDRSLESVRPPPFHWALPIQPANAALVPLTPTPLDTPDITSALTLDATGGIDKLIPAHAELTVAGDAASTLRFGFDNLPPAERDRYLRDYWRRVYDDIEVTTAAYNYDAATGTVHVTMDGAATLDWRDEGAWRFLEIDAAHIGEDADFKRDAGPHADAPFAVSFPTYARKLETVKLPNGGRGFTTSGGDVNAAVAAAQYVRRLKIENGVFTSDVTVRSLAPEFPAADAPNAEKTLRSMSKVRVFLSAPRTVSASNPLSAQAPPSSAAGIAAPLSTSPASPDAAVFLDMMRGVIATQTDVLAGNPNDADALTTRAIARLALGDLDLAQSDADAAVRAKPGSDSAHAARAQVFAARHAYTDAMAEINAAILAKPDHAPYLSLRGEVYYRLNNYPAARADFDRAIKLRPSLHDHFYRARVRDRADAAGRDADIEAALSIGQRASFLYVTGGQIEDEAGQYERANKYYTQALVLDPKQTNALTLRATNYLRLKQTAPAVADLNAARAAAGKDDKVLNNVCWTQATMNYALDTALADCNAAIALAPKSAQAIDSRAFVHLRMGKLDEALADYNAALRISPNQAASLYGRGVTELRKGMTAPGKEDIAAAISVDPTIEKRFAEYGVTP